MEVNARIYKRILAKLIDIFIFYLIFCTFLISFFTLFELINGQHELSATILRFIDFNSKPLPMYFAVIYWILLFYLVACLPYVLYELACIFTMGQTIGQKLLGIMYTFKNEKYKIIRIFAHNSAFFLFFTPLLPLYWLITAPIFLTQTFFYKKQTLYDLVIGINVVAKLT